jgi:hypothetical protein
MEHMKNPQQEFLAFTDIGEMSAAVAATRAAAEFISTMPDSFRPGIVQDLNKASSALDEMIRLHTHALEYASPDKAFVSRLASPHILPTRLALEMLVQKPYLLAPFLSESELLETSVYFPPQPKSE